MNDRPINLRADLRRFLDQNPSAAANLVLLHLIAQGQQTETQKQSSARLRIPQRTYRRGWHDLGITGRELAARLSEVCSVSVRETDAGSAISGAKLDVVAKSGAFVKIDGAAVLDISTKTGHNLGLDVSTKTGHEFDLDLIPLSRADLLAIAYKCDNSILDVSTKTGHNIQLDIVAKSGHNSIFDKKKESVPPTLSPPYIPPSITPPLQRKKNSDHPKTDFQPFPPADTSENLFGVKIKAGPPAHVREHDTIWDAVSDFFFSGVVPVAHRKRVGLVVRDLKTIPGVSAAEIVRRAANIPPEWFPATPEALLKHWHALDKGKRTPDQIAEIERGRLFTASTGVSERRAELNRRQRELSDRVYSDLRTPKKAAFATENDRILAKEHDEWRKNGGKLADLAVRRKPVPTNGEIGASV